MKSKLKCEDCPRIVSVNKLKRSPRTGRAICYVCKSKEDRSRVNQKLRFIADKDRDVGEYTKDGKKYGRVQRIVKFGIHLLRGEKEVLKDE